MIYIKCSEQNCSKKAVFNTSSCFEHSHDKELLLSKLDLYIKNNSAIKELNFSFMPLDSFDFSGKEISFSSFAGSSLKKANFQETTIISSFFDFTELIASDFSSSMIQFSVFGGANMIESCFNEATVYSSNFLGTILDNVIFKNADLSYSRFIGSSLKNSSFRNCNLKKTFFEKVEFDEVTIKTSNYHDSLHFNCKDGICMIESIAL